MPTSRIFAVPVAVGLAASLVVSTRPASALVNGDIAFASGRGTELFEIWSVDDDGGDQQRLIGGPPGSIEVDPALDPSTGTSLAFARKAADDETYDLFVKALGSAADAVKVTDENGTVSNDRQPSWSPTTSRIAFTRMIRADDTSNIWAVDTDGTDPTQLTETPATGYDAAPSWSNDGASIAFASDRSGLPQIHTMDSGGVTETQVTTEPCFHANPAWSPTSNVIVYDRLCPGDPNGWDIYSISLPLGSPTPVVSTTAHELQPSWSPDGDAVVFTRYPAGGGDKQLLTIDYPALVMETALDTDPAAADLSPEWGPASLPKFAAEETAIEVTPGGRDPSAPHGALKPKKKKTSRKVIKGVRFTQMRKAKSDVYVLKIDPNRAPRIDLALSNDRLPGREKTSRMAKRHKAVAAINGDFGTPSGRPAHTFAEDGDLKQVSFAVAPTFAMTQDEQSTHFERPFEVVTGSEHDDWLVERWNFGEPGATDIVGFTEAAGTLQLPPANTCSARLQAISGRRWAPNLSGVEVDYQVAEVGCATTAPAAPGPGQVVLSAQPGGDGGILVGSLGIGETVTLTWSIGFSGVLETVGGNPLLLENGAEVVPKPCTVSLCNKHPRTGIGVTPAGKILMVVVDGRREESKGVTLVRFARIMQGLHASFALNLDGGGSSTMVVQGNVVNVPSDGSQRKVSSAVLVLKGKDPGEVIGAPLSAVPSLAPAPPPTADQAGELAAMDPASTGGLAEAMAEGTFGPRVDLPRELRRALRIFRASR
jgi:Tol biopolymer transport system component